MESILDRIKNLITEKKITVAELERRADLGNGTIRKWDTSLPSADKIQKVARILGVTIDYLINGENEMDSKAITLARKAKQLNNDQIELLEKMIEQMDHKE